MKNVEAIINSEELKESVLEIIQCNIVTDYSDDPDNEEIYTDINYEKMLSEIIELLNKELL